MLRKSVLSACNAVAFKTKRFGEWIVGGVGGIAKGKIRIQINIMLGDFAVRPLTDLFGGSKADLYGIKVGKLKQFGSLPSSAH